MTLPKKLVVVLRVFTGNKRARSCVLMGERCCAKAETAKACLFTKESVMPSVDSGNKGCAALGRKIGEENKTSAVCPIARLPFGGSFITTAWCFCALVHSLLYKCRNGTSP